MIDGSYDVVHWNLRTGMMGPRPLSFCQRLGLRVATNDHLPLHVAAAGPNQLDRPQTRTGATALGRFAVKKCMPMMLGGLAHCAKGGVFEPDGTCPGGRRLLGWSVSHWLLEMLRMQ
jgi:hypothetical protein